ncbi:pantetheine-phosphate adenylyltransferase [Desulfovibrio sp. DS-1]|uniref:Phosphopantetheine adenylyltransferase n=2 Tax=Nitratidesulfovibrio TaxID=2802295 RepID=B8DNS6_NITV9|nr:pantetheine-phosphate adenylyltransferase [Nitratidesulfovibrio sp. SRB-5]RXF76401.1 pantetheine-phosphate adenylyltransferase [Desulfovibrio sp. DS-1]
MDHARERVGRLAIYPGTFDPLTNGHVSLIRRGCQIFDNVVVAVAADTPKTPLFSLDERVRMAEEVFAGHPSITVEPFTGLLVDYVERRGANVILRGLRAVSDFEYEFQLALMNRKLKRHIQTVFLMTDYQWLYISSTIIKAAASLGGDIKGLVPENIYRKLREKYGYPYPLGDDIDLGLGGPGGLGGKGGAGGLAGAGSAGSAFGAGLGNGGFLPRSMGAGLSAEGDDALRNGGLDPDDEGYGGGTPPMAPTF